MFRPPSVVGGLETIFHVQFDNSLSWSPGFAIQSAPRRRIGRGVEGDGLRWIINQVPQLQLVPATELGQWMIQPVEGRDAELDVLRFVNLERLVESQVVLDVGSIPHEREVLSALLSDCRRSEAGFVEQLVVA